MESFELRGRDMMSLELRATVAQLCLELKQAPLETVESVEDAIQRLENYVAVSERALNDRQKLRREGLTQILRLRELETRIQETKGSIARDSNLRSRQDSAFKLLKVTGRP
jgi:hypothetical protein